MTSSPRQKPFSASIIQGDGYGYRHQVLRWLQQHVRPGAGSTAPHGRFSRPYLGLCGPRRPSGRLLAYRLRLPLHLRQYGRTRSKKGHRDAAVSRRFYSCTVPAITTACIVYGSRQNETNLVPLRRTRFVSFLVKDWYCMRSKRIALTRPLISYTFPAVPVRHLKPAAGAAVPYRGISGSGKHSVLRL